MSGSRISGRTTSVANWGTRREQPVGVMWHYDGSASDVGAVAWLRDDPRCKVSYHKLILDDGLVIQIAPDDMRAWHAGICRPSDTRLRYRDANSALYGLCLAAKPGDTMTEAQKGSLLRETVALFQKHGWPLSETWRLTDHASEAWPRGRKVDIGSLFPIAEGRQWLGTAR